MKKLLLGLILILVIGHGVGSKAQDLGDITFPDYFKDDIMILTLTSEWTEFVNVLYHGQSVSIPKVKKLRNINIVGELTMHMGPIFGAAYANSWQLVTVSCPIYFSGEGTDPITGNRLRATVCIGAEDKLYEDCYIGEPGCDQGVREITYNKLNATMNMFSPAAPMVAHLYGYGYYTLTRYSPDSEETGDIFMDGKWTVTHNLDPEPMNWTTKLTGTIYSAPAVRAPIENGFPTGFGGPFNVAKFTSEPMPRQAPKYLTINVVGNGVVTRDPEKSSYNSGESVTLTANPGSGYTFSEWSGDYIGSTNPVTIVMDRDKTINATFTQVSTYTVNITHTYPSDLKIYLLCENRASQTVVYSKLIWDRQGTGTSINLVDMPIPTVDDSSRPIPSGSLPPGSAYRWIIRAEDWAAWDVGTILRFKVKHNGTEYTSPDCPRDIPDYNNGPSLAWAGIPGIY